MLTQHNLRACQLLFLASRHWRFVPSRAQVPFRYAHGYFIFRKWRFLLLPLSDQHSCLPLICVKQSHVYLARIWMASKPRGRMNWKGRSVSTGDFVLGSLAPVPESAINCVLRQGSLPPSSPQVDFQAPSCLPRCHEYQLCHP